RNNVERECDGPRAGRGDERKCSDERRGEDPAGGQCIGEIHPPCQPLGERLEHQLADSLQRIEHAVALHGNRLEVRRLLHPVAAWQLLDEVLTRMVRVGLDAMLAGVLHFPTGVERRLEIFDRRRVWKVALVVLDDERHLGQIVPVLRHVVVEILHRFEIGFHALGLGVAHEHDAINVLEYELAAGVVIDLTRHRIQVKARLEAANRSQVDGKEVEEESTLRLGRQRNELAARLRLNLAVNVLEIRSLAAEPGTIVNNLTVDLARGVVDHRHCLAFPHQLNSLSISSSAPFSNRSGAAPLRPRENTRSISSVNSSTSSFMRKRTRPTVVRESKIITSNKRRAMSATYIDSFSP